jgi:energy-coupling factor transporter ATP-binding protein EcfA2
MIEAHQLTKCYGEKTAVEDLSLTVRPGIVTGFLGPNGAGKSTTMRMILGLDAPTSGSVTVNGRAYIDQHRHHYRDGRTAGLMRPLAGQTTGALSRSPTRPERACGNRGSIGSPCPLVAPYLFPPVPTQVQESEMRCDVRLAC